MTDPSDPTGGIIAPKPLAPSQEGPGSTPHLTAAISSPLSTEQLSHGSSSNETWPHSNPESAGGGSRPSFIFFGVVSTVSLALDVASKAWAEIELSKRSVTDIFHVIEGHLSFELAYNRGGAWSLLQNAPEQIRKPFFLVVSLLAVVLILSLYSRLQSRQWALKWGLPLVFGGALGNFSDRLVRGGVVDFIAFRAEWILSMNRAIARVASGWSVTDHWPTFNVADISISVGVGLMAVDMLTSKRGPALPASEPPRRLSSSVLEVDASSGATSKPPSAG